MSDSRDVWFAHTRSRRQTYPIAWQGWLISLVYSLFVVAMVGVASAMASTAITIGIVFAILLVTFAYLRLIFRHARPFDGDTARGHNDA